MKPFSLIALATAVSGHTIFQRVSVNGQDQGQLKGVRAPSSNFPIQDVNDANMACNAVVYKDNTIIKVPAGARVGTWWQHVIGGPQGAFDPDNPIAASHKGPISVYLAKVDNAATASPSGLQWFKVAERGLNNGVWAVDELIANDGWHYFEMPSCVAPGQYLMRVELLALHSASSPGGAQFYIGCAQIEVTGSGTHSGSDFVSFPGAYSTNDPGIVISIYDTTGNPNNGGRPYPIPGPRPISCSGSGGNNGGGNDNGGGNNNGGGSSGGSVPLYGQCGGIGYTGPTSCAEGTCTATNEYYSQCLP